jgi:hypothetical protein
MKPPDHAVPSGDRAMARALMLALEAGGMNPKLASRFQSRDGRGDPQHQARLLAEAEAEAARLIPLGRAAGWRAWITYHSYYKAPDLIGPAVSRALGIPYALVEATRARKRLTGPWAAFAEAAEAACDAAEVIFYLTRQDEEALRRDAPPGQRLVQLRPFLPRTDLPARSTGDGPMLSVGMMREGDKLASYRLIAETLARLDGLDWRLSVAGDGPARDAVAQLMAPFGARVQFAGTLSADDLAQQYGTASLFFWPGVNEAFGMAYLEAQAAGLPVVAQDRPGVRDVLAPGQYPAVETGSAGLAAQITRLLDDPAERAVRGAQARDHIRAHHLVGRATQTLCSALSEIGA